MTLDSYWIDCVIDDFREATAGCEPDAPLDEVARRIARKHVTNLQDRANLAADILMALQVARASE